MPFAHIHLPAGRPQGEIRAMIDKVADVLQQVLSAPRERLRVWVNEVPAHGWGPDPEAQSPIVHLTVLEGRPKEQHHKLIAEITQAVAESLWVEPKIIRVCIAEVKVDSFGIGGIPASIARQAEISARAQKG